MPVATTARSALATSAACRTAEERSAGKMVVGEFAGSWLANALALRMSASRALVSASPLATASSAAPTGVTEAAEIAARATSVRKESVGAVAATGCAATGRRAPPAPVTAAVASTWTATPIWRKASTLRPARLALRRRWKSRRVSSGWAATGGKGQRSTIPTVDPMSIQSTKCTWMPTRST